MEQGGRLPGCPSSHFIDGKMEVWREATLQGYPGQLYFCGNELSIPGSVQHRGPQGRVQGSEQDQVLVKAG